MPNSSLTMPILPLHPYGDTTLTGTGDTTLTGEILPLLVEILPLLVEILPLLVEILPLLVEILPYWWRLPLVEILPLLVEILYWRMLDILLAGLLVDTNALSAVDQILVSEYGYTNNGDGTVSPPVATTTTTTAGPQMRRYKCFKCGGSTSCF
jgi:hypothetical protein